jgi:hypothetical protein
VGGSNRTIVSQFGWYEDTPAPQRNEAIQSLLGGFVTGKDQFQDGITTGLKNTPINLSNGITNSLTMSEIGIPGIVSYRHGLWNNPFEVSPFTYGSQRAAEVGSAVLPGLAFGAGAVAGTIGSGSMSSVTPNYTIASSPLRIPKTATFTEQIKDAGYLQAKYKWSRGGFKYEARWHTPTKPELAAQGNTWVITRTTPGNSQGLKSVQHVFTGKYQWTPMQQWQNAIQANRAGTATTAQQLLLQKGHWSSW